MARPAGAIDCPLCERMGRVTAVMPDGRLTTVTCANCHGEGCIMPHWPEGCQYCEVAAAGMLPATPLC